MRLSRSLLFIPILPLLVACTGGTGTPVKRLRLKFHDQFESRVPEFDGQLQRPVACDIDEDGYIYVLDEMKHHVVVFDNDMVAVRTIGREGWGRGEMKLPVGGHQNHMAVGGGYVAVDERRKTIHVFRKDGTFLNRFPTEDSTWDIAVRDDGRIIITSRDETYPIREYDIEGTVLARYGRPFVDSSLDSTGILKRRQRLNNATAVGVLQDGQVVVFGHQWPRLRFYSDEQMTSEAELDLMTFVERSGKRQREMVVELVEHLQEHSPEKIEALARSGHMLETTLDTLMWREEMYSATPSMTSVIHFTVDGENLWGFWNGPLFQMDRSGQVLRIFKVRAYMQADFAVGAGKVVFCDTSDRTIAVGRLPRVK